MSDLPYAYSFDFSQGPGPFHTWMDPSLVTGDTGLYSDYTRFNAPGDLDPNHIDGIGPIWLLSHLSIPTVGSPGKLNLTDADIDITLKTEPGFEANNSKLYFWIIKYVPETGVSENYYYGLQATNWAHTGQNILDGVGTDWTTVTVHLSPDLSEWTYAGNNVSSQGDSAYRYVPYSLPDTLADVDATLHLVFVGDAPDHGPQGFIDIENITIHTATPAIPIAHDPADQIEHTTEDTVKYGQLAIPAGIDAASAHYELVANSATHGAVTVDADTGAYMFTPEANFWGPDRQGVTATFEYVATDGTTTSTPQTVYFYIAPINDAPLTSTFSDDVTTNIDQAFNFTVFAGTDVDTDPLTYHVVDQSVEHGTIAMNAVTGRYTFTPEAGYAGAASFQYTVSDGQVSSDAKTVTVTVAPADDPYTPPTYEDAIDYLIAGDRQSFVYYTIRAAEAGDTNAAYQYGTWLRAGQNVERNDALGAQFLQLAVGTVKDASLQLINAYTQGDGVPRDYAKARELLNGIYAAPEARYELGVLDDLGFGAPVNHASAVNNYISAAKAGNADAMYTLGRRYLAGQGADYQPEDAYFWLGLGLKFGGGPDVQQFRDLLTYDQGLALPDIAPERKALLDQAIADWTVGTATPVNDAPTVTAGDEENSGSAGAVISGVLLPGTDRDGDTLSFQLVAGSSIGGSVTIDPVTGAYHFTPLLPLPGEVSFAYRLNDGQDVSEAKTVTLTYSAITAAFNDNKTLDETATVTADATTGVLANDAVVAGGGLLSIVAVAGLSGNVGSALSGTYGTLTLNADGSYDYVADKSAKLIEGQTGTDSFSYTIEDELGTESTASLIFTINGSLGTVLIGDGVLFGSAYDDVLTGVSGGDVLIGLDGNDRLQGGVGLPNTLQGGNGDDVYVVANAGDSIIELPGGGTDTIETGLSSAVAVTNVENLTYTGTSAFTGIGNIQGNVITGGGGDDFLSGLDGDDTLHGGGGNDVLLGGSGSNVLDGGAGVDTAYFAGQPAGVQASLTSGVAINGYGGTDQLIAIENLVGSDFADTLTGDGGTNILNGLGGDDWLIATGGNDVLIGGDGFDTVDYSNATVAVTANLTKSSAVDALGRNDTIAQVEALVGSNYDDVLVGDANANRLDGGLGRDVLVGFAGNDTLVGGDGAANELIGGLGNDIYIVTAVGDTVVENAGEGTDTVRTNLARYQLANNIENLVYTGIAAFSGTGNALDNTLTGGSGNDLLTGLGGNNTLIGGAGIDRADYSAATSGVTANLLGNLTTANGYGGIDILSGIENVTGSAFNDVLIGDANANRLEGGLGRDVLIGFGGDDVLVGGDGVANQLQGGIGNDTYIVSAVGDTIVENPGEGTDTVQTNLANYQLANNVENLFYTGTGAFTGTGNALDNMLSGGSGNDTLDGGAGDDTVVMRGLKASYTITTLNGRIQIRDLDEAADGDDGTDTLIGIENVLFKDGERVSLVAPIALDLDNNGITLTSAGASGARAGSTDPLSWIGPGDGFLFYDRDGNGSYTGFDEMSFAGHRSGALSDLDGLRSYDTNGDGILSAADDGFARFGVWRDANSDGVAEPAETYTLKAGHPQ
ncbi:hypothetical protein SPAN111604_09960 [Sphingomonas antarctica]|uniref:tandem-95 repeat protein n=1 Tax=Sphingomonas antarctica TaxID=2040274 RepID=UPI0039E9D490